MPPFRAYRKNPQTAFFSGKCAVAFRRQPLCLREGLATVSELIRAIRDLGGCQVALVSSGRAQMRPIHRPPRVPSDRHPHCAWTVVIDESYPEARSIPALDIVAQTRAATWELEAVDRSDDGLADYSGPLVSDLDFGAFSHSALVRMADEVCLQMHLLYLSFAVAVRARAGSDADLAASVGTRQLIGLAGLGAERIHRALSLPGGIDGVLRVFELHPLFNPLGYVNAETSDQLHVHQSPAHDDASWISLCSPDSVQCPNSRKRTVPIFCNSAT